MKRIAVDMDDTSVDTSAALIALYNRAFGATVSKADLKGRYLPDILQGEQRDWVIALLYSDRFFRGLPPMEGSQHALQALMTSYEVFITTAAMEVPGSFAAKFEWLREHLPFVPPSHIVFCGDKGVLAVDYLIDDQPRHFQRLRGQGIIFTAPHNVHETGYPRVDTWSEVVRMFLPDSSSGAAS